MIQTPETVLAFWLEETPPEGWYRVDPALDAAVRERFRATWDAAAEGMLEHWHEGPEATATGALAYLIVTDQFPRNMFRDDPRAFATDALARAAARGALERGFDLAVEGPARQFFYLPFMHSEHPGDQDLCLALISERLPGPNLLHARAHREVIRRYGRFPYRNAVLGRGTTAEEAAFLDAGGYAGILRELGE